MFLTLNLSFYLFFLCILLDLHYLCTQNEVAMQKLVDLYRQWSGEAPQNVQQLTAGGSNREYYRMTSSEGKSVVGCVGTSRDENHALATTSCATSRPIWVPCRCSMPFVAVVRLVAVTR